MYIEVNWISVKDALPLKSGDYLVCDGSGLMVTSFNHKTKKWNKLNPDSEDNLIDFWDGSMVLFWSELPEMP